MCTIFGVFHAAKAAELCTMGLHAMQHRAIDFAGMESSDGKNFYHERGAGLARNVFTAGALRRLHGLDALGHLRYPTVLDEEGRDNIQPLQGIYCGKPIAIAHNGNLTNTDELKEKLNIRFATSIDSECILRLLESECSGDIVRDLTAALSYVKGSYALCILLPDMMIAVRGPSGNRPLSIGQSGESFFVSSETCAFPMVEARHVRDVERGEIAVIQDGKIASHALPGAQAAKFCRFESIYLALPSSKIFGESVAEFRLRLGLELERVCPAPEADYVVPVPDSSTNIAIGYGRSGRSGAYMPVIYRSHYAGRTFIAATQANRDAEVAQKFTFAPELIEGKSLVVVDDSIVRGTTLPKIVRKLRWLGAREVHVRIGSPPMMHPCRYGVNTPTFEELIAANKTIDEMRTAFEADTLAYLPLESLKGLSPQPDSFCYACMDGEYWH